MHCGDVALIPLISNILFTKDCCVFFVLCVKQFPAVGDWVFVMNMILLMLDCCGGIMNGVGVKGGNGERIVMAHLR